jgi:chemotaxis protein histidine kinase CheA
MSTALLLSFLVHALLLSVALGGQTFGLPGLNFLWKERRLGANELQILLAPTPVRTAPRDPVMPAVEAPVVTPDLDTARPARRPDVELPLAPNALPLRTPTSPVADNIAAQGVDVAAEQDRLRQAEQAAALRETARQEQVLRELAKQDERAQQEAARLEAARKETLRQEQATQAQLEAARQETARQELVRQESAKQEAARQMATRLEATKQEAARQELARQEAARQDATKQELARQDAIKQEAARQESARQELAKQDAARQDAVKQDLARQEAAKQEASRQERARQDLALREKADEEAKREERLRAIGKQLNEEAAQRDPSRSLLPTVSGLRRGWLLGRTDPNADLVLYAQTMSRKIESNMTFDMVRAVVKQAHVPPQVTVALRADGSVEKITFVVSSGVPAIDDAIRKVVASQASYGDFPPALARQYDVIEIRRTWIFDTAIRLQ